ncbi:MAG: SDR family NAD(P)-dependent oxidoreductase [Pseudonocardiaceae bacterium]|nr:SDR family NAD(P)-dependent oxidoreductase [Pseudonocardiaceae bacterium]
MDNTVGNMTDRVALVSGASSGIGAAIARAFVDAGARVHGVARREETMIEAVGRDSFVPHALDVADADAVSALATQLATEDPVDTLVCAAGTNIPDRRFHQLTNESFDELLRVNLSGVFYLMKSTLDQVRERAGDMVLISSVSAAWPDHSGLAYQATKAGLLGLARGAGWDEHASGVRVSTILPGIVNTPILDRRPEPPPERLRGWCLQPEDVASACLCAVTLPARANIAEMTIVPTRLQSLGNTQQATPPLPEALN